MDRWRKNIYLLTACLAVLLMVYGCGIEKNENYQVVSGGVHEFESNSDHGEYLASVNYYFEACVDCHGDDLRGTPSGPGGSRIRSCYECHNTDNHLIGFTRSFEHDEFIAEAGWDFTSCYNCHSNMENTSEVSFGGSCGSSACHDSDLGGPEACNTCHGNFSGGMDYEYKWAPPSDLSGNISTSVRGVGAHQAHLRAEPPVSCDNCHVVPNGLNSDGHLGTDGAEVIFSGMATEGSFNAQYDYENMTCSVYCHGDMELSWVIPEDN